MSEKYPSEASKTQKVTPLSILQTVPSLKTAKTLSTLEYDEKALGNWFIVGEFAEKQETRAKVAIVRYFYDRNWPNPLTRNRLSSTSGEAGKRENLYSKLMQLVRIATSPNPFGLSNVVFVDRYIEKLRGIAELLGLYTMDGEKPFYRFIVFRLDHPFIANLRRLLSRDPAQICVEYIATTHGSDRSFEGCCIP